MFETKKAAVAVGVLLLSGAAHAVEVAVDPGLEAAGAGGFPVDPGVPVAPGWVGFTGLGGGVPTTTTVNPNSGTYAGQLSTVDAPDNPVLKNANIGIGTVNPGNPINISFFARGTSAVGGVAFAEFFSEVAGGGTSANEILGGGPLALTPDWQQFNFSTVAGPDVSGGVTLQFVAAAGGAEGSFSELFVDDISVQVVPIPAAVWLFGSALGLLGITRRKAA